MKRCIFLDKDGTLIRDVPYNVDISKISFYEDIFESLQQLVASGYSFILISNQSGIARRYFDERALRLAFDHIGNELSHQGLPILDYYFCPHLETSTCSCRKPLPGMIEQAALKHRINLSQSWMVGDILADTAAGRAAGCRTILIDRSGLERSLPLANHPSFAPDYVLDDFKNVSYTISNFNHTHDEYTRKANTRNL